MDAIGAIILMYLIFWADKETLLCLSVSERLVNTPGNSTLMQSDKGKASLQSSLSFPVQLLVVTGANGEHRRQ